jgi:hypothetical protein
LEGEHRVEDLRQSRFKCCHGAAVNHPVCCENAGAVCSKYTAVPVPAALVVAARPLQSFSQPPPLASLGEAKTHSGRFSESSISAVTATPSFILHFSSELAW